MNYLVYILLFMSFLEAQQEILLDRVASVVENKIVLMSDVVLGDEQSGELPEGYFD